MRGAALFVMLTVACSTGPDVRAHLDAVCLATGEPVVSGIDLPRVAGPLRSQPSHAVHLDVYPDRYVINGHAAPTLTTARGPLLAARLAARKHQKEPVLVVSAPRDLPARRVLDAVALTTEAFEHAVVLAFSEQPISLPAPLDPTYDAELRSSIGTLPPAERAPRVASEMQTLLDGCPAASKALTRVAVAPPAAKCTTLAEGLGDSVAGCWGTDRARVATLARFMATPAYATRPTAVPLDLQDLPEAAGTWEEVVRGLRQGRPTRRPPRGAAGSTTPG